MKALIINGSPHRHGATATALRLVEEHIQGRYDIAFEHAYELEIKPCRGCMGCRPDRACVLPLDDGHRMGQELQASDLLVLGVPSYWSNLPAPLKVLFDRNVSALEYCLDKPPVPNMVGRRAVVVVSCASDETRCANPDQLPLLVANLRYIVESAGYELVDIIQIPSSWNREAHLPATSERIRRMAV